MIYAQGTNYTTHASDFGVTSSAIVTVYYTLVDEAGDTLVDEAGDTLVSAEPETQYGFSIMTPGTDYTVHGDV